MTKKTNPAANEERKVINLNVAKERSVERRGTRQQGVCYNPEPMHRQHNKWTNRYMFGINTRWFYERRGT